MPVQAVKIIENKDKEGSDLGCLGLIAVIIICQTLNTIIDKLDTIIKLLK